MFPRTTGLNLVYVLWNSHWCRRTGFLEIFDELAHPFELAGKFIVDFTRALEISSIAHLFEL